MVLASNYTKGFLDNRFENQLGVSLHYKWLGNTKTRFRDGQKQSMDALRLALLQSLITEIEKKDADFTHLLSVMDASKLIGQTPASAKAIAQKNFYDDLIADYEEKFAYQQAALLTRSGNFKTIRTSWTSITANLPLLFPKYNTTSSYTTNFISRHPYAASVVLEHTRLWESSHGGRLFLTGSVRMLFNNAKLSYDLHKLSFSEYKTLGGTDNQVGLENDKLYIGAYKTFITPCITARAVYYPVNSHVGVSLLAEQSFGSYQLLNLRLAIPIVLINSQKTPAVTIECFILFLDCTHRRENNNVGKTQSGLSVGIPFSRLMF